jgi:phi LC3 family holin
MSGSKWRNGGLWVAMVSAVLLAAQAIGAMFGFEISSELIAKVMAGVNAVLLVLATAGIVSNPSSGAGFKDK